MTTTALCKGGGLDPTLCQFHHFRDFHTGPHRPARYLSGWTMVVQPLRASDGHPDGQAGCGQGGKGTRQNRRTGGGRWPLPITSRWMQFIAKFTPHGWATAGFDKLLVFGADFGSVVLDMLALWVLPLRSTSFRYGVSAPARSSRGQQLVYGCLRPVCAANCAPLDGAGRGVRPVITCPRTR